jgi:hypothetical protein
MARTQRLTARDSSYFERLGMAVELERLQKQATDIRDRLARYPARILRQLGIGGNGRSQDADRQSAITATDEQRRKWRFSAETRRRMALAQQARWAKKRGANGAESLDPAASEGDGSAANTVRRTRAVAGRKRAKGPAKIGRPRKRTMSPEARKRIGDAQRKRWAERKRGAAEKKR